MNPKLIRNSFFALLACATLSLTGCSQLGTIYRTVTKVSTYETTPQTATQIIVEAEKYTAIAADTFDEFLRQEYRYSAEVKKYIPKVHEFAEYMREPVPDPTAPVTSDPPPLIPRDVAILKTARSATKTFKANRTPDGEANLRTAIATVKDLLAKSKSSLSQLQPLKGP